MSRPPITVRTGKLFDRQLDRALDWLEANSGGGGGSSSWGSITGTLSAQTDLQSALDGKADSTHTHAQSDVTGLSAALSGKQDALVSGTNIKTVNGNSLLGSGNLSISGGGSSPILSWVI